MKKVDLYKSTIKVSLSRDCVLHISRNLSLPDGFGLVLIGPEGFYLHVDSGEFIGTIMDGIEGIKTGRINGESNWFS